jgi:hypothetical protein
LIKHDRITTLNDIGRLVDVHEGQQMYEELIKECTSNMDVRHYYYKKFIFPVIKKLNFEKLSYFQNNEKSLKLSYLFTSKELRMPLIICVWVMVAQQFTGAAAIFAYSTNMFLNAGLEP